MSEQDAVTETTGTIDPTATTTTTTTEAPQTTPAPAAETATTLLTKEESKAPEGAPEKYTDFTVPEGFKLDPKMAEEAQTMFKDMNLSQANAQRLIDMYVARTQEASGAAHQSYLNMRQDWVKEVMANPDLGPKLNDVKATISRALDSLGNPTLVANFKQAMDITGAGDNPAFISTFYAMAQRLTEGKHVSGAGPSGSGQKKGSGPVDAASALFPNLP